MSDDLNPKINDPHGSIWRKHLLARLAAERAYLLLQYRGLNEETLTTVPAAGDLTFKDVLLHVAAWDAFHSEKINLVRNGRSTELQHLTSETLNQRNVELFQHFQTVPLEQSLATSLKERAGFLAELSRVPDVDLHRRMTTPSGQRVRMRTWARWRFLHDIDHANELAAWRSNQIPDVVRHAGPKYILRAIFNATRKEFLTLVDLLPADERTTKPVCGVWDLKDLVGHLTDWERVGLDGLCQLADGQTPAFDYEISDFDVFNNENAEIRATQSWKQVWSDFSTTRKDFKDVFDQMPAEALTQLIPTPWGGTIPAYVWVMVWAGHEHEHAIDVRGSLNLRNWPRRLTSHK